MLLVIGAGDLLQIRCCGLIGSQMSVPAAVFLLQFGLNRFSVSTPEEFLQRFTGDIQDDSGIIVSEDRPERVDTPAAAALAAIRAAQLAADAAAAAAANATSNSTSNSTDPAAGAAPGGISPWRQQWWFCWRHQPC